MVPLAPKLKVITYHFISYRRKSVLNLVEIQNTFVCTFVLNDRLPSKVRRYLSYVVYEDSKLLDQSRSENMRFSLYRVCRVAHLGNK